MLLLAAMAGFVGMEAFSWAFHKYLMHGVLWHIHQTHHRPGKGFFELNDLFSLMFGTGAALAIYFGLATGQLALAGVGMGVTGYGLTYFVLHDIAIHGRLPNRYWQRLPAIARIRRAHKIHHKQLAKDNSRAFGLLFVSDSVFEESPSTQKPKP